MPRWMPVGTEHMWSVAFRDEGGNVVARYGPYATRAGASFVKAYIESKPWLRGYDATGRVERTSFTYEREVPAAWTPVQP